MSVFRRKSQVGMIEIALLGLVLFFTCAVMIIRFQQGLQLFRTEASHANAIAIVQSAVQSYAAANKSAFQTGKTIMYIDNQNAPTIAELQSLGFLDAAAGTNVVNPFGSTYAIKVSVQPNKSITGGVYLTSSVLDAAGQPDQARACGIARAFGDTGVCTAPNNSALLQNRTSQLANPSGKPAVVGALIFVAP